MGKKYMFTDKTKEINGHVYHQIKCVADFRNGHEVIKAGTLGGWIESESNLSQEGGCWIYPNSYVCDESCVSEDGRIGDGASLAYKSQVCGNAFVCGKASLHNSIVKDRACVYGSHSLYNVILDGHMKIETYVYTMLDAYDIDKGEIESTSIDKEESSFFID